MSVITVPQSSQYWCARTLILLFIFVVFVVILMIISWIITILTAFWVLFFFFSFVCAYWLFFIFFSEKSVQIFFTLTNWVVGLFIIRMQNYVYFMVCAQESTLPSAAVSLIPISQIWMLFTISPSPSHHGSLAH